MSSQSHSRPNSSKPIWRKKDAPTESSTQPQPPQEQIANHDATTPSQSVPANSSASSSQNNKTDNHNHHHRHPNHNNARKRNNANQGKEDGVPAQSTSSTQPQSSSQSQNQSHPRNNGRSSRFNPDAPAFRPNPKGKGKEPKESGNKPNFGAFSRQRNVAHEEDQHPTEEEEVAMNQPEAYESVRLGGKVTVDSVRGAQYQMQRDISNRAREQKQHNAKRSGEHVAVLGASSTAKLHSKYIRKDRSHHQIHDEHQHHDHHDHHHHDHEHDGEECRAKPVLVEEHAELTQELIDRLEKDNYECMICYEVIKRDKAVWSCKRCYAIFHMYCIKLWSRQGKDQDKPQAASASIDTNYTESSSASSSAPTGTNAAPWRCPACQLVYSGADRPRRYTCFCSKVVDPRVDPRLVPHTCGDVCTKLRKETPCPHPCVVPCHPGPCPPCILTRTIDCYCGKSQFSVKCSSTTVHQSCGQTCGKTLNCGIHKCTKVCHDGECGPCQEKYYQECYCGKKSEKERLCTPARRVFAKKPKAVISEDDEDEEEIVMRTYPCGDVCGKTLNCGNHTCTQTCHPDACQGCSRMPDIVTTCPCGKASLSDLGAKPRTSCLDPIPTCKMVCGKRLGCGIHFCKKKCHDGECEECSVMINLPCRCGSISKTVPCVATYKKPEQIKNASLRAQLPPMPFRCERPCGAKKSCGKHKCDTICCPSRADPTDAQGNHVCRQPCNRLLECKKHKCEMTCHRGACHPCYHTIYSELTCTCGKTVLMPPQPCGTQPPECSHECSIARPCGHPVDHTCHPTTVKCLPCQVLVEKSCAGGHTTLKCACHIAHPSCGAKCNKVLVCGQHHCQRVCHAGDCVSVDAKKKAKGKEVQQQASSSSQANDKEGNAANEAAGSEQQAAKEPAKPVSCGHSCGGKLSCGHRCEAKCHPPLACNPSNCKQPVNITCPCGRLTKATDCKTARKMVSAYRASIKEEPKILTTDAERQRKEQRAQLLQLLECDDECHRQTRIKNMAEALCIQANRPPIFYEPQYTEELLVLGRRYDQLVVDAERKLHEFVNDPSRKILRFEPAPREKRQLLHHLCEQYGLISRAEDPEPHRSIVATKTDVAHIPSVLLSTCLKDPSKIPKLKTADASATTSQPAAETATADQGQKATTKKKKKGKEVKEEDPWPSDEENAQPIPKVVDDAADNTDKSSTLAIQKMKGISDAGLQVKNAFHMLGETDDWD